MKEIEAIMKDVLVKAKAKMGKLPDENLYYQILKESSVERKIDLLKEHYPFLEDSNDKVNVERTLYDHFFKELKSIDYFLKGIESEFFNSYYSKYEIYMIQEIIESIVNENLENNFLEFKEHDLLRDYDLSLSMNLEDFIESMKNTRYYRTLLPFLNENMNKESVIFLSSNALMKFYYRDLLKLSKKFPRNERKLIEDFIGEEINLANLEMLYRLKSFFDLNNNEIFNYLIEGGKGFNADRLKELSELSLDDFLKEIDKTKYAGIFDEYKDSHIEIEKRKLKLYTDEIIRERSDILFVIGAMNIIYLNIEDIISFLEIDDSFSLDERYELMIVR